MAFVYRSPRNLSLGSDEHCEEQIEVSEKQEQIKKKPRKGLASLKTANNLRHHLQQLQIVQDGNQMYDNEEIQCTAIKKETVKAFNNLQSFFKSKCPREVYPQLKESSQLDYKEKTTPGRKHSHGDIENHTQQWTDLLDRQAMQFKERGDSKKQAEKERYKQRQQRPTKPVCRCSQPVEMNINLLNCKTAGGEVYAIPSIPGQYEKYGYVINENTITYPTIALRTQGIDESPGPANYSCSLNKKVKGVLSFNSQSKSTLKNNGKKNNEAFCAIVCDVESLNKHNQKIKEFIDEKKKRKASLAVNKVAIQEQENKKEVSTASHDSSQSEEEDGSTPGPGYYNCSSNERKDFRSRTKCVRQIFYSQSQRFKDVPTHSTSHLGVPSENSGKCEMPSTASPSQSRFFASKLKRQIRFEAASAAYPPPGHYDVRINMENEAISSILKASPNTFNNNLPRLAHTHIEETPGPGTYFTKDPHLRVDHMSAAFCRRANKTEDEERCLKEKEANLACHKDKQQVKRIHEKKKSLVKQAQAIGPRVRTEQRGSPNTKQKTCNVEEVKRAVKAEVKIKQNIHPFNSTGKKGKAVPLCYIAEVGLYDVAQQSKWEKRSFNVLFN